MNYEDEEYVRYYTRETVGWKALGWEGQTVLALMLHGKFDRSGVFDCDGHEPSHAVTLVTGVPIEVTAIGLKRLTDCGAWVIVGSKIVWPKYVHAQSCRRTDKARQRESRDKRRVDALNPGVTTGHAQSHAVTPGHNLSLLAEQSRAELILPKPKKRSAAPKSETKIKVSRKKPVGPCPDDLQPLPRQVERCAKLGANLEATFRKFKNWHAAKGSLFADWHRAFDTWLDKREEFADTDLGANGRAAAPDDTGGYGKAADWS